MDGMVGITTHMNTAVGMSTEMALAAMGILVGAAKSMAKNFTGMALSAFGGMATHPMYGVIDNGSLGQPYFPH
jgi:hypothetical protein